MLFTLQQFKVLYIQQHLYKEFKNKNCNSHIVSQEHRCCIWCVRIRKLLLLYSVFCQQTWYELSNSNNSINVLGTTGTNNGCRHGSVVKMSVIGWQTFPGLCLIYGWHVTTLWVKCPLWVNQPGKLSLPFLQG